MLSDGCYIQKDAIVESSVISPGVLIRPGAVVKESIIMTDTIIESGAVVERAIIDKRVHVGENARVGGGVADPNIRLTVVGKNSIVPPWTVVEPEAEIDTDVIESDYPEGIVRSGTSLKTKRKPHEV
jgi:glucose-1-phosphate adenylyltransferase